MLIPLRFQEQHVVVFGGTTGINFGIADAFASRGASVTVVSRKPENVAHAVERLNRHGGKVAGHCTDVRNFDGIASALQAGVQGFGPIDVLVSGAAGNFLCEAKDMSANGFKVVVDIDLIGSFNVLRQAWTHLRKPGASVINITAPQSAIPMRYQAHACAAKAGVDQLTRVLALEWGPQGVRVNAISPGPIAGTEGVHKLMGSGEAQVQEAAVAVPLQRMGTLDDIASLALFLASPYAGFLSGAIVPCDGGGALESVKPALEAAGRSLPVR